MDTDPTDIMDKQKWHKCIYVMLNSTVVKSCPPRVFCENTTLITPLQF